MVGAIGIARRVNARLAVERVNFQSRIVGETVYVILVEYVLSLLMRVGFQRVASLRNVLMAANVGKRDNVKCRAKNFPYLLELVLVVGRKYYFHLLYFR